MLRRELQELLELLDTQTYQTAIHLAGKLGVSEKTVRLRLKDLNEILKEHGAEINARPRHGYRVCITDDALFQRLTEEKGENRIPDNSQERSEYLLAYLVWHPGYVKAEELCDFLYISKTTLTKALKSVETVLNRYGLEIDRKPNYGMCLRGRELDVRRLVCDYFVKRNYLEDVGRDHMEKNIRKLAGYIRNLLERYEIHLSEMAFENFLEYVYVSGRRIQYGHYLELKAENLPETGMREQAFVRELIEQLSKEGQVTYSKEEESYLLLYLAGKRMVGNVVENESNFVIREQMDRLVLQMLDIVQQEYHIDFHGNFDVRMTLNQHLVPLDIRLRFDIPLKNPMLEDIKEKYSLAYQISCEAAQALRDHYKKEISEDEIGYFALIFELAIEKNRMGEKTDILVVCSTGKSSSRLLKYKYEQEFADYLNQIYVCDLQELERFDFSKVHYVFTTVPITMEVPVPIVEVGMFLGEEDIHRVMDILRRGNTDYLKHYYRPERFFGHFEAENKEQVLEKLCELIVRQEQVDEDFYDLVLERESYIQMDYGNLIAIPHPNRISSEDTFAYVAVLEHPVIWNHHPAQVILLSSVGRKQDANRQKFYEATAKFALSETAIRSLIQNPEYEQLMSLMQET